MVPARALAAGGKPLRPEPVELQLPPQRQRQPARSPLPRPHQPHLRQPQAYDGSVRNQPVATVLGKQRQRPWSRTALLDHLDRFAPCQLLVVVDLAQIQHVALHHPTAGRALVLHHGVGAVLLAVLSANLLSQEHGGPLAARRPLGNGVGRHHSTFPSSPLAHQVLARRKIPKPSANPRSWARATPRRAVPHLALFSSRLLVFVFSCLSVLVLSCPCLVLVLSLSCPYLVLVSPCLALSRPAWGFWSATWSPGLGPRACGSQPTFRAPALRPSTSLAGGGRLMSRAATAVSARSPPAAPLQPLPDATA